LLQPSFELDRAEIPDRRVVLVGDVEALDVIEHFGSASSRLRQTIVGCRRIDAPVQYIQEAVKRTNADPAKRKTENTEFQWDLDEHKRDVVSERTNRPSEPREAYSKLEPVVESL
jgi:hypothetical protein